jgi:hypothetical protein
MIVWAESAGSWSRQVAMASARRSSTRSWRWRSASVASTRMARRRRGWGRAGSCPVRSVCRRSGPAGSATSSGASGCSLGPRCCSRSPRCAAAWPTISTCWSCSAPSRRPAAARSCRPRPASWPSSSAASGTGRSACSPRSSRSVGRVALSRQGASKSGAGPLRSSTAKHPVVRSRSRISWRTGTAWVPTSVIPRRRTARSECRKW